MRLVDDEFVGLALKLGLQRALVLEIVEVLQEQHPRRLLGVVELRRAAGLFPEHVVDVLEYLLEAAGLPPAERFRASCAPALSYAFV